MENVIQFADYEVLLDKREVRRDGARIALGGRAFDMLMAFVGSPGDTLTKDDLLQRVWPETVVEDSNVYTHVSALRAAFNPGIVATIPGRGYRFQPVVEMLPGDSLVACGPLFGGNRLFGRARQARVLMQMLTERRLVTITGAGGVGKSALARAHVEALDDPAGWVWADLSEAGDAQAAMGAIAGALDSHGGAGTLAADAVVGALRGLTVLLVLDNAEHLAASLAPHVRQILQQAPGVKLCVTSQVPLKLDAERLMRLDGLELAADGATLEEALCCGSVQLFADQAQSVLASFKLASSNVGQVVQICRRLEGLPLSLKLAADRLPLLGLTGLMARMDESLRLLTCSRPHDAARHQSLRITLERSIGLLPALQQSVLLRLASCSGSFTLAWAAAAADGLVESEWELVDIMAVLVDHSLVTANPSEDAAYRLPALSREFLLEKIAQQEQPGQG